MTKPQDTRRRRRSTRAATNSVVPNETETIIGDGSGIHFFGKHGRINSIDAANPLVGQAIATVTGEWPTHGDNTVAMAVKKLNGTWLVGSR